jgi:flagellar L-ring protein precursor FlgH
MRTHFPHFRWTLLACAGLACAGCLTGCRSLLSQAYEPRTMPAPQLPIAKEARIEWPGESRTDGSLWSNSSMLWFADDKARQPGDVVLVQVVQRNTGTKNANTDTDRSSSFLASIRYFLGMEDDINTIQRGDEGTGTRGTTAWNPVPLVEAKTSNEFKGNGETARTDTLTATVSAVVTDILPNGNLVIYGHQSVTLNHEASMLTVQGIVRPSDISSTNVVQSERIANADIRFTGSGVITDKQHPGWAVRAMDWVWPF